MSELKPSFAGECASENESKEPTEQEKAIALAKCWRLLKAEEAEKAKQRKDIEKELAALEVFEQSIKEKPFGARPLVPEFLNCSVSEKRDWDQDQLFHLYTTDDLYADPENWPFDIVFKENRAKTKKLAEEKPEVWANLKPLLTVSAGNPSFTAIKKKEK